MHMLVKKRVVIVHGIWGHGDTTIDRLGNMLEEAGYEVVYFEYPVRFIISLYWPSVAKGDGERLANFQRPGDDVIAHSYGCLIVQNSIKAGAKWGKCFLFAGAATSDKMYYPDDSLERAYVIYNPEDKALFIGSLLPFHPFGKLGYHGYSGQPGRTELDRRFQNIRGFKKSAGLNHSHYFDEERRKWFEFINQKLREKTDESTSDVNNARSNCQTTR